VVGLPVELGGLELAFALHELVGLRDQQPLDLDEAKLVGELDREVPVVEEHAAVDGQLDLIVLQVALDGILAEAVLLEDLADLEQQWVAFQQVRD